MEWEPVLMAWSVCASAAANQAGMEDGNQMIPDTLTRRFMSVLVPCNLLVGMSNAQVRCHDSGQQHARKEEGDHAASHTICQALSCFRDLSRPVFALVRIFSSQGMIVSRFACQICIHVRFRWGPSRNDTIGNFAQFCFPNLLMNRNFSFTKESVLLCQKITFNS